MLPAIAATIDAAGDLVAEIGNRRLLLVLDNFEQSGRGAAVSALLSAARAWRSWSRASTCTSPGDRGGAGRALSARSSCLQSAPPLGVELDPALGEIAELCARSTAPARDRACRARTSCSFQVASRLGSRPFELLGDGPVDVPSGIARSPRRSTGATRSLSTPSETSSRASPSLPVLRARGRPSRARGRPRDLGVLIDKSLVVLVGSAPSFGLARHVREFAAGRSTSAPTPTRSDAGMPSTCSPWSARQTSAPRGLDEVAALSEIARRHEDVRAALAYAEAAGRELALVSSRPRLVLVRPRISPRRRRLEAALARAAPSRSPCAPPHACERCDRGRIDRCSGGRTVLP